MTEHTEHTEQAALFRWAVYAAFEHPELRLLYANPNAGKRSPRAGAWMVAEGLKRGVPDICLPVARQGYHALYIEMKSKYGRLRPEQKWYLEHLAAQGNLTAVAWSYEEARGIIEKYLEV